MKILLVDDELNSLRALVGALESDGHTVTQIDDPDEAEKRIRTPPREFQLVILDKTIRPKRQFDPDEFPAFEEFDRLGVQLVHLLCGILPRIPIIFLSGFLDAEDRKELARFANVYILDKGQVRSESLLNLIRRVRY